MKKLIILLSLISVLGFVSCNGGGSSSGVEIPSDPSTMKYMEYMFPALLKRACHPVLFGSSAGQAVEMFGLEDVREWEHGVAMRYRSRRGLMEIISKSGRHGRSSMSP